MTIILISYILILISIKQLDYAFQLLCVIPIIYDNI